MKVEVAILGSPFLISLTVSVDVKAALKQRRKKKEKNSCALRDQVRISRGDNSFPHTMISSIIQHKKKGNVVAAWRRLRSHDRVNRLGFIDG